MPGLYQINLDQRLGLIIIFVCISAFFSCPILLSSPEALSYEKRLLKWSNENCFSLAFSHPTCRWVENMEVQRQDLSSLPVLYTLISDVVEVLNHNWGKWLHRESSIETWSQEALIQSQSTR